MRSVSLNKEVKLSVLDGSISHEIRNDSSDTSSDDSNPVDTGSRSVLVSGTTVSLENILQKKMTV